MLTWGDFFKFDDSEPIDNAVKKIEHLEQVYQKMISAVEDSNQRLAGDMGAVQQNAEELLKTVAQLNLGMEKNQKVLSESAGMSEELVKEYMALKDVQAMNVKQIHDLQVELNKLTEAKEKAKKGTEAEAGSIDDLRIKLAAAEKAYKAMGESTDSAIKEEQLEKVRGLASEYKKVNSTLADAKKGATAAAGSYNELSARVAEAKKKLRDMDGGLQSNSKEFKELKKFAKEGTDQLKAWDEAVGDNTRHVGDYKNQISQLIPGFSGVASSIDTATTASKGFLATPLGLFILFIAGAVASLTAYFKGSAEGQDDFNKVAKVTSAIFETLKDVVEAVGKTLFTAITEPKKTWEKFVALIKPIGDYLKFAFENPMQALKDFGNALYNSVIIRLQGLGNIMISIGKIIRSGFTDGFKDLANAAIQAATGVEDGVDKIVKAFEPLTAEMEKRIALGLKIAKLENKLRKDRIADIVDDGNTELEVNRLLLESQDKLRFSNEERFAKLRQANALLADQLKGDLDLIRDEIQLQKLLIQQDGDTYEARQKLAELQAQEAGLQSKFLQERKRRQKAEIALIREMEKEMIDAQKRIVDANAALDTVRLADTIKTNQKILADENTTLEQRIDALMKISDAQQEINEGDRDKQLAVAKEAALGRIELSAEATDAIYNQEEISLAARIELERKAKEELLSTDQAYGIETQKINEDFANKTAEILATTSAAAEDNVFKILARDAGRLEAQIKTGVNDQITALDQALAAGNISVAGYQAERQNILKTGVRAELNTQLDFLENELKLYEGNAQKRIEIEEKISKARRDLAEQTAEEVVAFEQRLQQSVQQIQGEAIAFASQTFNAGIQSNIDGLNSQLAAQEEAKNRSIQIAGDDAQAKAAIEQSFAIKKKEIERQIAQEKRKQAVFQKAIDATGVVISTAKGIASAVAESPLTFGLPWSAFMAVTGALQLGRILSAPIPQYFTGKEFTPDGLGWVADRFGREIVVDPRGNAKIYDKPTIIDMERGSTVIPNYKTESILRQADQEDLSWQQLVSDGYRDATERIGSGVPAQDNKGVIRSIEKMKSELVTAIKNQPQDFYDEKGFRHYEAGINARVNNLNKRYTLQ